MGVALVSLWSTGQMKETSCEERGDRERMGASAVRGGAGRCGGGTEPGAGALGTAVAWRGGMTATRRWHEARAQQGGTARGSPRSAC